MSLKDYFSNVEGIGTLATADPEGKVNVALYARPHVIDEEKVAFIMNDRLSHANVAANPYAAYMFVEQGEGYHGKRLTLKMVGESTDEAAINEIRRRETTHTVSDATKFLVTFEVVEVRPLVGT